MLGTTFQNLFWEPPVMYTTLLKMKMHFVYFAFFMKHVLGRKIFEI